MLRCTLFLGSKGRVWDGSKLICRLFIRYLVLIVAFCSIYGVYRIYGICGIAYLLSFWDLDMLYILRALYFGSECWGNAWLIFCWGLAWSYYWRIMVTIILQPRSPQFPLIPKIPRIPKSIIHLPSPYNLTLTRHQIIQNQTSIIIRSQTLIPSINTRTAHILPYLRSLQRPKTSQFLKSVTVCKYLQNNDICLTMFEC